MKAKAVKLVFTFDDFIICELLFGIILYLIFKCKIKRYINRLEMEEQAQMMKRSGLVCIINISEDREGSEHDVERLIKLYKDLNFTFFSFDQLESKKSVVKKTQSSPSQNAELYCYSNLTKQEIFDLVTNFAENDTIKGPRFLYIMSHGDRDRPNCLIDVKNISYHENDILKKFTTAKVPHLKDELKCIVFNCCRDATSTDEDSADEFVQPIYDNLLVAHSTINGKTSLRHPNSGSPYMEALCDAMRLHFHECTIFEIFNKTAAGLLACSKNTKIPVSSDYVPMGVFSDSLMKCSMSTVCMDHKDCLKEIEKPRENHKNTSKKIDQSINDQLNKFDESENEFKNCKSESKIVKKPNCTGIRSFGSCFKGSKAQDREILLECEVTKLNQKLTKNKEVLGEYKRFLMEKFPFTDIKDNDNDLQWLDECKNQITENSKKSKNFVRWHPLRHTWHYGRRSRRSSKQPNITIASDVYSSGENNYAPDPTLGGSSRVLNNNQLPMNELTPSTERVVKKILRKIDEKNPSGHISDNDSKFKWLKSKLKFPY